MKVRIEEPGVGLKRVRLTNIAPETSEYMIKMALEPYGEIRDIKIEIWARTFRFSVDSGTRIVKMTLKKHIPPHLLIVGRRYLVYYDGQPVTLWVCRSRPCLCGVPQTKKNGGFVSGYPSKNMGYSCGRGDFYAK
jgi:hypothetical protein